MCARKHPHPRESERDRRVRVSETESEREREGTYAGLRRTARAEEPPRSSSQSLLEAHPENHIQKITSRDSPADCRCSRARQTLTTGKMAAGRFLLSLSQRKVHFQPRGTTVSLCGRSGATVCVCVCVDPVHEIPRELPHSAIICHFSGWLVTFVRFFLKFFVFGFSECEQ